MTCETAKPYLMAIYGGLVTGSSAMAVINPVGLCFYLGLIGLVLGPVLMARAVPTTWFQIAPMQMRPIPVPVRSENKKACVGSPRR